MVHFFEMFLVYIMDVMILENILNGMVIIQLEYNKVVGITRNDLWSSRVRLTHIERRKPGLST